MEPRDIKDTKWSHVHPNCTAKWFQKGAKKESIDEQMEPLKQRSHEWSQAEVEFLAPAHGLFGNLEVSLKMPNALTSVESCHKSSRVHTVGFCSVVSQQDFQKICPCFCGMIHSWIHGGIPNGSD